MLYCLRTYFPAPSFLFLAYRTASKRGKTARPGLGHCAFTSRRYQLPRLKTPPSSISRGTNLVLSFSPVPTRNIRTSLEFALVCRLHLLVSRPSTPDLHELPFPEERVWPNSWSLHEPPIRLLPLPTEGHTSTLSTSRAGKDRSYLSRCEFLVLVENIGVYQGPLRIRNTHPSSGLPLESGQTALRCDCRIGITSLPTVLEPAEFNRFIDAISDVLKESADHPAVPQRHIQPGKAHISLFLTNNQFEHLLRKFRT